MQFIHIPFMHVPFDFIITIYYQIWNLTNKIFKLKKQGAMHLPALPIEWLLQIQMISLQAHFLNKTGGVIINIP
jgi:hypothetical protein